MMKGGGSSHLVRDLQRESSEKRQAFFCSCFVFMFFCSFFVFVVLGFVAPLKTHTTSFHLLFVCSAAIFYVKPQTMFLHKK